MSEHYTEEEVAQLREANPLGPPCSHCKVEPVYIEGDGVPHMHHREGCIVGQRVRELLEDDAS